MTSRERMMNRIQGKPVDRIPNMNIVMQLAADENGYHYGQVVRTARLLADGMLKCRDKYGLDCLWTISDPVRESQDVGADVVVPERGVPHLREPFIKGPEDFRKLKLVNPCDGRGMSDRIEAVRLLKEAAGDEAPVVGWIEGAFASACNLTGVESFLFMVMEEPEAAEELLDFCFEQEKLFALEQVKAGADIIGMGDAATSLIGKRLYQDFALEREKKMISAIHEAGSLVKLHICGNINSLLEDASSTGTDILDIDHMVDFRRAGELMLGKGCVCGNFDPVQIVHRGTPEIVKQAVRDCVDMAPENCIIAAGCEIPMGTDPANFRAVHEALCELQGK